MAAIVTFDFDDRIITEISASGDNELNVDEIYSEWKIAAQLTNNLAVEIAFSTVGPLVIGEVGASFFLENGWKIRPAELDHELILVGNLFSVIGSPIIPTTGGFTVLVSIKFSNIVDKFASLATRNDVLPLYAGL